MRLYKFYFAENPISEVKQSGKRRVEPGVLTKTQLEQLLSDLGIREQLLVLTAAITGLRRSELAGLKWSDMDLVNGWISVNRSVDNNLENPCKTEASRKVVPLDLRIVPFFQRWYEVSLFKAPEDYVFAAGSNRAGGREESNPSLCPWFSGITSSQQPTDLESSPRFLAGTHSGARLLRGWWVIPRT